MSLFVDSIFSAPATDASSTPASSGSTPPTTVADTESQLSDTSKHDVITVATGAMHAAPLEIQEPTPSESPPSRHRPKRTRVSEPVYNLARLSGTDRHGRRRARGYVQAEKRRRTISGDTLVGSIEGTSDEFETSNHGSDALHLLWSPSTNLHSPRTRRQTRAASPRPLRTSSRLSGVSSMAAKVTSMGNKGRKSATRKNPKLLRELKRLQDTNEFSGVDDRPVLHTVWSNGKYVDPDAPSPEPPRRRTKDEGAQNQAVADADDKVEVPLQVQEPVTNTRKRREKKYLVKGLYAGQDMPFDALKGLTVGEKKKVLASLPELAHSKSCVNKIMPPPIYMGLRTLVAGRDFKLPYHVCNPMPPGQPKPDEWKKMTKNRFIGDSKDYWRKMPHLHDVSKCVCKPEDGCGDNCQNRIMLYECDDGNCNVGKSLCTNRSFADLAVRRAKGGKYRVGVEVIKTSDRGYGVRSNRCFKPNQIIMEYTGEIITEEECERRMNEEYKNNECYYLMSFDQNMIIDATTGSIARFVNHSCNPNCRMIKWIVSGQPRMALFAGDRPITTGDELTYDYNFDPFSAKNVQSCLCGESNCRGVLGPKSRDVKPAKTDLKKVVKAAVKAGKRKLKELIGGDKETKTGPAAKKRKIATATGLKRSISNVSLKAAKGAASALKKGVSSLGLTGGKTLAAAGAKKTVTAKRGVSSLNLAGGQAAAAGAKKMAATKKGVSSLGPTGRKAAATGAKKTVTTKKVVSSLGLTGKKAARANGAKKTVTTKKSSAVVKRRAGSTATTVKKSTMSKLTQKKGANESSGSGGRLKHASSQASSITIVSATGKRRKKGEKSSISPGTRKRVAPDQIPRPSTLASPRRIIKLSPKARANAAIRLVQ